MNPKSGWSRRKHHLPRDYKPAELLDLVQRFINKRYQYQVLQDYYIGKQDILNRTMNDASKPNNRVVNNFAKLIVDTNSSYFMGQPITYVGEDEKTLDKVHRWLDDNDAHDVDAELAKLCSMMGHAFEFHWINAEGKHKFKYASPMDVLAIYSADLDEELLCAVNISCKVDARTERKIYQIEIYDSKEITRMQGCLDGSPTNWEVIQVKSHLFGEVPVIEYIANEERQGDFESIMTQIDAYDQVVSDSVNDIEYWNDSYLLLRDLQATTLEDIQEMKNNRVLMVDGTGDASFLTRSVNDTHIENIKNRLVQDIHKHAQTPNLSDEQFATNLSGTAIRYKLLALENRTSTRERKFTKALLKRLRLGFHTMGLRGEELTYDIKPVFVRNLPANLVEIADMTIKLKDIVSDETLRSQIPFVSDLEKERELIAEQKLNSMEMQMFPQTLVLPQDVQELDSNQDELISSMASSVSKEEDTNDPSSIKTTKSTHGNGKGNDGMNTHNLQNKKAEED